MLFRKRNISSHAFHVIKASAIFWVATLVVVPLADVSLGQDSFTLEGPNPSVNCIDSTNGQTWVLQPDQNGFYIIDDTNFGAVPIAIKPGARDASVFVSANDNIGMGTTTPLGLLDLRDKLGTSSVVLNPGSNLTSSLAVNEVKHSAIFTLKTLNATKIAQIGLKTPNGGHSFWSSSTGDFLLRDDGVNRTVMTVFKSTLNNNLLTLRNGNVGLARTNPTFPIHLKSGAHCTVGGVWTNASSRELKQNIAMLDSKQAATVVSRLRPVTYQYKSEPTEEYVGFIAEDVPELLATNDRKSLAAMDVVAVLTKVVQDQQNEIAGLTKELHELKATQQRQGELVKQLARQEAMILRLADQLDSLAKQSANVHSNAEQDAEQFVSAR